MNCPLLGILLLFFITFSQSSPQVIIIFPTEGQVIPLGMESTYVTVVWTSSGFVATSGSLVVTKDGYPVATTTAFPIQNTQYTFLSIVSFGINISGTLQFTVTVTDGLSTSATASRSAIISPAAMNSGNGQFLVPYCAAKCNPRIKIC